MVILALKLKTWNEQSILIFLKGKKNSELKVRDNFVVTGSHKGGAVVILNVKK